MEDRPKIDWILLFYLDYLTARSYDERRVELSERIQEIFSILLLKRAKADN